MVKFKMKTLYRLLLCVNALLFSSGLMLFIASLYQFWYLSNVAIINTYPAASIEWKFLIIAVVGLIFSAVFVIKLLKG